MDSSEGGSNNFETSHLKYLDEDAKLPPIVVESIGKRDKKLPPIDDSHKEGEERTGDVVSSTGAVLTLSKAMFNTGCFSLPYAWKRGGLWVSFITSILVLCFNWYGNHVLVKSSQHLAKKSTKHDALDYGHLAQKVCQYSEHKLLRGIAKPVTYFVNATILFYQLGLCSVSVLFISVNMVNLGGGYLGSTKNEQMFIACTICLPFLILVNMFTRMKVIAYFAMTSAIFFAVGIVMILQYTVRQPNQFDQLPASSDFTGTATMIGILMYAFEGQTMMLPVENKLKHPETFLAKFGVLSTTMLSCGSAMTAIGFLGYTSFGDQIAPSITSNVPKEGLYSAVNISLMIQTLLVHSIALYVIIDVFYSGFSKAINERCPRIPEIVLDKGFRLFWVLVTYGMAIGIPHLEIMIPLVGVTSGTLCALVFPPLFEMMTFWDEWKSSMSSLTRGIKISWNCFCIFIGVAAIAAGVYSNAIALVDAFSEGKKT
ncbi:unnamed protein product, partial [Mesorhabditis belari]|uniref:Amino acid transporter transmembrane domain-containing protein n=1 Tax=Mesorhabditis belari TaxID=2138241 RepID=A0AAF3EKR9_9BILA